MLPRDAGALTLPPNLAYTVPGMDPYGKRELLDFFGRHLRHHGDSPQAVRWTARGQQRRYEAFLAVCGDLEGKSVLDFGCGKGDFLGFLQSHGVSCSYTGVDIHPDLVALARSKHPEAEFIAADIEEHPLGGAFDVVLACGVFNLRVGGIGESVEAVLPLLFGYAREALHANFLSARAPRHDVELHYVDPAWLLDFARGRLSPNALVREDLVPDDVFLSVRR
jgi:SAM-dependent methyltransferase